MEKRVIQKANENLNELKKHVLEQLQRDVPKQDMIRNIEEYTPVLLEKNDFVKRNRTKNAVPVEERCIAKNAKQDQCTRRRKPGHNCCGTHIKGMPHGFINSVTMNTHQKEIWVEEINGIMYYLDHDKHVYKAEDVEKKTVNPSIIGKWSKSGDSFTIHRF